MKIIKAITLIVAVLSMASCSTSIKTTLNDKSLAALAPTAEVVVFGISEQAPAAKIVGEVKIGDTGFTTKCDYATVIEQAKNEARKAGGNALKLLELKPPSALGSTCYRIEADILLVKDMAKAMLEMKEEQDAITRSKFPPNPDYALLYVYRRDAFQGSFLNYTIHLEGVPLFKIYNNDKQVIKVHKEGLQKVRASLETEDIKEIDIKFGEEYFLECSINPGVFIGRPNINFVDKRTGRAEYDKIKKS